MQVSMRAKVAAASGLSLLMAASLGFSAGTANAAVAGTHAQLTTAKVTPQALRGPQPSPWVVLSDPEPSPWLRSPQPSPWVIL
jgi:hypothetical protein